MCMLMTIHIAAQTYGRSIARTFFDNVEKWVVSNRYADRKAIVKSCGDGMRVNDADQQQNVIDASRSVENAALTGKP